MKNWYFLIIFLFLSTIICERVKAEVHGSECNSFTRQKSIDELMN